MFHGVYQMLRIRNVVHQKTVGARSKDRVGGVADTFKPVPVNERSWKGRRYRVPREVSRTESKRKLGLG